MAEVISATDMQTNFNLGFVTYLPRRLQIGRSGAKIFRLRAPGY